MTLVANGGSMAPDEGARASATQPPTFPCPFDRVRPDDPGYVFKQRWYERRRTAQVSDGQPARRSLGERAGAAVEICVRARLRRCLPLDSRRIFRLWNGHERKYWETDAVAVIGNLGVVAEFKLTSSAYSLRLGARQLALRSEMMMTEPGIKAVQRLLVVVNDEEVELPERYGYSAGSRRAVRISTGRVAAIAAELGVPLPEGWNDPVSRLADEIFNQPLPTPRDRSSVPTTLSLAFEKARFAVVA